MPSNLRKTFSDVVTAQLPASLVANKLLHADYGRDRTSNVSMPSKLPKTFSDVATAQLTASMKFSSRKDDDRDIHDDEVDARV